MRQIGTLPTKDEAVRFADYLLTQGVEVKAEEDSEGWAIWVRDENQLQRAREELDHFEQNPGDERYHAAHRQAAGIRREEQVRREQIRRNMHEMRERWNRPLMQRRPLTVALILLSVFVTFMSVEGFRSGGGLFADFRIDYSFAGHFTFVEMRVDENGQVLRPANGWASIQRGEVWRLATPAFLHFGVLHILFNCYWLGALGGMIEERRGTWRLGLLALAFAAISNVAEFSFTGHALFGGMSGVVYGLFGYIWMKVQFEPRSGFFLDSTTILVMIGWLFLCMTGVVGNVANTAHVAGLLTGMTLGYLPILLRPPKA